MWPYFYTFFLLGMSVFLAISSFWRLFKARKFREFFLAATCFAAVGWAITFCLNLAWYVKNRDERLWFVFPFVMALPMYLCSGFILNKYIEVKLRPATSSRSESQRSSSSVRRKLTGLALMSLSVGIWIYGIEFPIPSRIVFAAYAMEFLSGLVGFTALATMGK